MKKPLSIALTVAGFLAVSQAAVAASAADLAKKKGCLACHAADKKLVGPSYNDIAAKYKGDAGAADKLAVKVKTGGSGVWGPVPMPPNNVTPDEAKALSKWVLDHK